MESFDAWAVKIATAVCPSEVDIAPMIAQAFAQGGEARRELLRTEPSSELGGFGPAQGSALFPWVLHTMANVGDLLYRLLASNVAGHSLAIVVSLLNIQDIVTRRTHLKSLPDQPYAFLKQSADAFARGLAEAGLPQEQCDTLTLKFLLAILEHPAGAQAFIKSIQGG